MHSNNSDGVLQASATDERQPGWACARVVQHVIGFMKVVGESHLSSATPTELSRLQQ